MAYCYEFRKAVLEYMKRQGIESKLLTRKNNLKLDMEKLKKYVLDHPDMYQKEIAEKFKV